MTAAGSPDTFHDQTVTAPDGTTIAWSSTGDGPPVVLVHGITESARTWEPLVAPIAARGHRVLTLDLRGHGESGDAESYDLQSMAFDVATVVEAAGLDAAPHLVGHSLGGVVVSALGAVAPVASVVNVDQSLQLADFKALVTPLEPVLRDPAQFDAAVEQLFGALAGTELSDAERARVDGERRPSREVVLGVWGLMFESTVEELEAVVEAALAGYAGKALPYLNLFGADPGDGYGDWFAGFVDGAVTEVWDGLGHYPHLVRPGAFVDRLEAFWG
ncbi:MAG: alpha/beta fold hydrolase [Acidimicrobiales bacterium]